MATDESWAAEREAEPVFAKVEVESLMPSPWFAKKVAELFSEAKEELMDLPFFRAQTPAPPKEEYPFLKDRMEQQSLAFPDDGPPRPQPAGDIGAVAGVPRPEGRERYRGPVIEKEGEGEIRVPVEQEPPSMLRQIAGNPLLRGPKDLVVTTPLEIFGMGTEVMEPIVDSLKAGRYFLDVITGKSPRPGTYEFHKWWEDKGPGLFTIHDKKFMKQIAPFLPAPFGVQISRLADKVPEDWTLSEKDLTGELIIGFLTAPGGGTGSPARGVGKAARAVLGKVPEGKLPVRPPVQATVAATTRPLLPRKVAPQQAPPVRPVEVRLPGEAPVAAAPPPPPVPPTPPVTPAGLPAPARGPGIMGNLSDFSEVVEIASRPDVWRTVANLPGVRSVIKRFNPSAVTVRPVDHAIVGRAVLRDQGQQLSRVALARLNAMGTQKRVFGVLTEDGRLATGPLKGLTVNTVRTYPQKYAEKLTQAQKQWVEQANKIERAKLAFLKENGIPVRELSFEEGGEYAGRRVWAKLTNNGEFLDAAYIGPGPGRLGAKLAAEKQRVFKTAEEAVAEGYRYLSEDEALYLNVTGAYNRVADKRMTDWLLTKVNWRGTGAPEGLVMAAESAKLRWNQSRQLVAALNRAVRGERVPDNTISSIGGAYPHEAKALKRLIPRLQANEPTADAVQRLTKEAKALMTRAELDWRKAARARDKAKLAAERTSYEEATVPAPAFAGKILTGTEARETARILKASLEPNFSRALDAVNQVNAVSRYFMLAGDASPMMIQLLFLAGSNPKLYGKAGAGFAKAMFNPLFHDAYLAKPANVAIAHKYPNLILTRGGTTEFTEAMARGGLLRKGPLKIAGKVLEPFQRGFESSMDVAGIELAKALDHLGTTPARIADVTQFVNEFRGVTSSSRLGVSTLHRQAEAAAILAPRYNRAIASLLFDVSRGNLRGDLARKALARGVAAISAMAVAISYARGESFDEIVDHFIPGSGKFFTWEVAGQNVGPGTKIRSVLNLFAATARDPGNLWNISQYTFMRSPGWRFLRGNLSPVFSTGLDLLTGRDYIGDPSRDGLLSFSKTVGKNFILIWAQTVALEGGTLADRAVRGGFEFFGGRAYPVNIVWKLGDEWREATNDYYEIATSAEERKEKGQRQSRLQYRDTHPEVDAKLFVLGRVTSLRSPAARLIALRLIRENDVLSYSLDDSVKESYEKVFPGLIARTRKEAKTPTPTPPAPWRQGVSDIDAGIMEAVRRQEWLPVRSQLDLFDLRALAKVWYEGGKLTEIEERKLRNTHRIITGSRENFNVWLKQTLRNTFEQSVIESGSRKRQSPEPGPSPESGILNRVSNIGERALESIRR